MQRKKEIPAPRTESPRAPTPCTLVSAGLGFEVWGLRVGVRDLGFGVWVLKLGFGNWGLGFGVWVSGLRVEG